MRRSQASLSAGTVDDMEARRSETLATLRDALERRRIAGAAVLNLGLTPRRVPLVSPADGFLAMCDESAGAFEIVSAMPRSVDTSVLHNPGPLASPPLR
jgi:hypothetical protein